MYIYIYTFPYASFVRTRVSLSVRWCFRRNYATTALRPSREQVHSLNLVFIIARFRANGVFNSARRRGKIVEIFAVYTFEISDSLFHQFTRRFRHRSVIRSFMACKACSLARETRRIEGYSNRFVGYRNRPFFFFSSVATRIEIRLWYFPSTFFLLFYPVYFPSYSPFYFFTCLLFVFFFLFQFEDRYFVRHCLATFIFFFSFLSSFLFFFPSLFTFYRSSRFNAS